MNDDEETLTLIVPEGEMALVTDNGMTTVNFYFPELDEDDDEPVPVLMAYLTACLALMDDRAFVKSTIERCEGFTVRDMMN